MLASGGASQDGRRPAPIMKFTLARLLSLWRSWPPDRRGDVISKSGCHVGKPCPPFMGGTWVLRGIRSLSSFTILARLDEPTSRRSVAANSCPPLQEFSAAMQIGQNGTGNDGVQMPAYRCQVSTMRLFLPRGALQFRAMFIRCSGVPPRP